MSVAMHRIYKLTISLCQKDKQFLVMFAYTTFGSDAIKPQAIFSVPVESTVVLQEHLNKWYSLTMYCVSKILIDLPVQVNNNLVLNYSLNKIIMFLY